MSGGGTLTLTTSASQTWSGTSGGNWSTNAWTSRVPLPQDDVVINAAFSASQTVTADMPRLGKSIDWTGATGTPTFSVGNISVIIFGSLTLIAGMTMNSNGTISFHGRSAYTLTSAGKTAASSIVLSMPGGTLTLQDAVVLTTQVQVNFGTFNANNFNVTVKYITSISVQGVRTITMGSGTWTLTGTGTVWNVGDTSGVRLTLNANTSTISITDTSSSSKTFNQDTGFTYNNLSITGGGTGAIIFVGSNTFANLPQITGGTKTLTFTAGTTQTFTGGTGFGNGTNLITMGSSSPGSFLI